MTSAPGFGCAPLVIAAATDDVLRFAGGGEQLLSAVERERAAALLSDAHRRDFIAAHVLLRICASRATGAAWHDVTIVQCCPECGGPHGAPRLAEFPELHASLAHTQGYVCGAVGSRPVGVDVERRGYRSPSRARLAERVLAASELTELRGADDAELAFLKLWVRKEALVKVGAGSLTRLRELDLGVLSVDGPGGQLHGPHQVVDWVDADGFVGAAVSEMRPRLECFDTQLSIGASVLPCMV